MPIYEFECKECHIVVERLVLGDPPPPKCPKCLAKMKKRVSLGTFVLKGDGWAKDGYSKKST